MNNNKPPMSHHQDPSLVTELRQLASLDTHKDVDPLLNGINGASSSEINPPPPDDSEQSCAAEYTSLQDIIVGELSPTHHSPTCHFVMAPLQISPTAGRSCCWGELDVAISNPLVKQAAIAYLQPKMTRSDIDHRGWTERFRDYIYGGCGGGERGGGRLGCLGFVGGVFAGVIGWILGNGSRREEMGQGQRRDHRD